MFGKTSGKIIEILRRLQFPRCTWLIYWFDRDSCRFRGCSFADHVFSIKHQQESVFWPAPFWCNIVLSVHVPPSNNVWRSFTYSSPPYQLHKAYVKFRKINSRNAKRRNKRIFIFFKKKKTKSNNEKKFSTIKIKSLILCFLFTKEDVIKYGLVQKTIYSIYIFFLYYITSTYMLIFINNCQ